MRSHHVATAALLLGIALPVLAEKPKAPACPTRPIVLALYEFGNFYHAGGGLDKDVADLLAARSGCRFEQKVMLRGRIWQELQDGSVDMTLSAAATPERTTFAWAVPYMWVRDVVIINKDAGPGVKSMDSFLATPGLRLGVARGHAQGQAYVGFVAQLRNIARVEEVDDTNRLFAMLRAKRFHAVVSPQLVYPRYLAEFKLADQVRVEDWAPEAPRTAVNLLLSKKSISADAAQRWAALLNGLVQDGSLLKLVSKYTDADAAKKMLSPRGAGPSH